jgi:hypothetical protein
MNLGRSVGGFNLLEVRKLAEFGSFRLSGAAAGDGDQGESSDGDCGDETDHGEEVRGFLGFTGRFSPENRPAFKKDYFEGA